jgi:hypothetical protein
MANSSFTCGDACRGHRSHEQSGRRRNRPQLFAAFSALKKAPPVPAMVVQGDLSVQGNIKGLRSLVEPLQIAMDKAELAASEPFRRPLRPSGSLWYLSSQWTGS